MPLISVPLVILAWVLGGQINKLIRPIAVPLSLGLGCLLGHVHWYLILPVLLYGFTLTLGHGQDSKLMKWLKSEQELRIVVGLINALPIFIVALLNHPINVLWVLIIVAVFCIRLGSWGKIGKYDILPVDIFRGLIVGLAYSVSVL